MKYLKAFAIIATIMIMTVLAAPLASADTSVSEEGTATIAGEKYAVLKKWRTTDPNIGDNSHLMYAISQNSTSEASGYRVLVLNEENYDKFILDQSFIPFDEKEVGWPYFVINYLEFTVEDVYYLIIDNGANTDQLVVDYSVTLSNADILSIGEFMEMVWLMIIGIIIALVVIILVIVLLVRKKKTAPPPVMPPMGPQPVSTKFCTACGKSMPGDARVCPYCGKQQ